MSSKEIAFSVISDPHICPHGIEPVNLLLRNCRYKNGCQQDSRLAEVGSRIPYGDFTICLGDSIDVLTPGVYKDRPVTRYFSAVAKNFDPDVKFYTILGNHDIQTGRPTGKKLDKGKPDNDLAKARWRVTLAKSGQSFMNFIATDGWDHEGEATSIGEYQFYALNSSEAVDEDGMSNDVDFSEQQIKRLNTILDRATTKSVVLFWHINPIKDILRYKPGTQKPTRAEIYLDVLYEKRSKILAVFFGHSHGFNRYTWPKSDVIHDGIDFVGCGSVGLPSQPYDQLWLDVIIGADGVLTIRNEAQVVWGGWQIGLGKSTEYDTGSGLAIALDDSGNVVEVHRGSGTSKKLYHRIGKAKFSAKAPKIVWGKSTSYDTGSDLAIALDNAGNVVEVHRGSRTSKKLYYRIGKAKFSAKAPKIVWGKSTSYDTGSDLAIALDDSGNVVEVHRGSGTSKKLYYRIGKAKFSAKAPKIVWGKSTSYDTGSDLAIALDNAGNVVEYHRGSGTSNKLYYRIGKADFATKRIVWGRSTLDAPHPDYDTGSDLAIALNDAGNVVEVHRGILNLDPKGKSKLRINKLYYRIGKADFSRQTIGWGKSTDYDTGSDLAIALDNANSVVEVHRGSSLKHRNDHYCIAGSFIVTDGLGKKALSDHDLGIPLMLEATSA